MPNLNGIRSFDDAQWIIEMMQTRDDVKMNEKTKNLNAWHHHHHHHLDCSHVSIHDKIKVVCVDLRNGIYVDFVILLSTIKKLGGSRRVQNGFEKVFFSCVYLLQDSSINSFAPFFSCCCWGSTNERQREKKKTRHKNLLSDGTKVNNTIKP